MIRRRAASGMGRALLASFALGQSPGQGLARCRARRLLRMPMVGARSCPTPGSRRMARVMSKLGHPGR
jgi:hypothetical protein